MKFRRTIGSVLLGVFLFGSMGTVAGCGGGWNGSVSESLSGAGTQQDPYLIQSGGDLAYLRDKLNADEASYKSATYSLGQDINLGDREWTPMKGFAGTFLGNGHKITHLKVTKAGENSGLFASLSGAVVKDLSVSAEIQCAAKSGILAGEAAGNTVISNVTVSGSLTGNDQSQYLGGIVGYINTEGVTTISDSVNNAEISGLTYVGGIAGVNALCDVVYDSCVNNGKISGKQNIGGIAGYSFARSASTAGKFVDCRNNGTVDGEKNLGGITGTANLPLIRCTSGPSAAVTADDGFEKITAGGMAGFAAPFIGKLCGLSNYDGQRSFSQMTDCTDEFGWAVTTTEQSGCVRFVDYKDKVYLFGTTNKYAVSEDGGRSFGPFTTISTGSTPTEIGPSEIDCPANAQHKLNDVGNTQPFVLKDGRLAIFYRAHYKGTFSGGTFYPYSSIRIRISDKNGVFNPNDEPIMLIETGSSVSTRKTGGLWEPFPMYLEDGTIAVYIASDVHLSEERTAYGRTIPALDPSLLSAGDSQNIIMVPLTIEDNATEVGKGITIGTTELAIKGSKTNEEGTGDGQTEADGVAAGNHGNTDARPGMPVVTTLKDGSYAMIVESCDEQKDFWDLEEDRIPAGYNGNAFPMVIQISYSKDGHKWTQPETIVRPAVIGKKCAAPGIATLPDGRVIITYHTTMDYVGGTPNDSARMQQLTAAVSKEVLTYGAQLKVSYRYAVDKVSEDKNSSFIQLPLYRYSENESCVWGNVNVLKNGRVYIGGQHAINTVNGSTVTSATKWTLIMERDASDLPKA